MAERAIFMKSGYPLDYGISSKTFTRQDYSLQLAVDIICMIG